VLRLLLAAPWLRAPLLALRQPAVAMAMAITAALLALAAASYPLYLASSGSGALAVQISQQCPDGLDAAVTGQGPARSAPIATSELDQRSTTALIDAGANRDDLQSPVVTLDANDVGLRIAGKTRVSQSLVQLVSATHGLQNISVLSSAGGLGVWLSNDLAQAIGARAGSEVSLSQDPQGTVSFPPPGASTAKVRVAGIYANLVGSILPSFWCSETSIFGTPDSGYPPPPVVLAPPGTVISLLDAIKAQDVNSYQWKRTLSPGLSIPEAKKVLTALNRFNNSIGVQPQFTNPGYLMPPIGGGLRGAPAVDNQLVFIVAHAEAIQEALRSGILPVAIAGIVISGLLVAVAGTYWVDRRRLEVILLSSRGAGPVALGIKAALESLLPVIVGALVGWLAAFELVRAIGPSSALPEIARLDSLWSVLAAAALALALVCVVVSLRVREHAEGTTARNRLTRVPIELVGLGLAMWAWSTLGHQSFAAQGTSAPAVGAAFLVFPILFVLSLAALGARLSHIMFSSHRFGNMTAKLPKPVWLAARRLSGASLMAAVSIGSTAAAIGVLVYAASLTSSQDATLHAKATVFVGSTSSVQLISPGPVPATLGSDSTEVVSFQTAELDGQQVDVLGVDTSTFVRGAFWDRSFASESLEALMSQLDAAPRTSGLPVIVAGAQDLGIQGLGSGTLQLTDYQGSERSIPVDVVATASVFPGENSISPLVVMNASSLERLGEDGANQVWSQDAEGEVLGDLSRANEPTSIVVTTANVLDQTTFAAIQWTFAYLQALGTLSGAVIIGGLLLFVTTRASKRALAYVLSRRMGLRRVTHLSSLAIELAVMIAPGAFVGGLFGWIAVELAESHLDPLPLISPPPLLELPHATIAAAAGATVLVWAAVCGWAQHVTDRSRASELLRADT
jgi:putative ABC transport system permease protein